jgi:fructose-1,6-bisphosphatase/inositol monophosphatase family enzyme
MDANILAGVGDILRHAAATAVMPRFAALGPADSEMKAPGEPVTIADREAEVLIASGLRSLLPRARVIGEEACAADPALLDGLADGAAWIVDPIDGTANFATGRAPFAMMVALLEQGETVGAWILDPLHDRLAVAELGSGAWIDGKRITTSPSASALPDMRGIVSSAFCPPEHQPAVDRLCRAVGRVTPTVRCAGHEYPLVATKMQDFLLYWRTLVWDHAPGALLLTEAGGVATYLDGSPYRPTQARTGLLLAHNAQVSASVLNEYNGGSSPRHVAAQ